MTTLLTGETTKINNSLAKLVFIACFSSWKGSPQPCRSSKRLKKTKNKKNKPHNKTNKKKPNVLSICPIDGAAHIQLIIGPSLQCLNTSPGLQRLTHNINTADGQKHTEPETRVPFRAFWGRSLVFQDQNEPVFVISFVGPPSGGEKKNKTKKPQSFSWCKVS